jgi:hypothetical protein
MRKQNKSLSLVVARWILLIIIIAVAFTIGQKVESKKGEKTQKTLNAIISELDEHGEDYDWGNSCDSGYLIDPVGVTNIYTLIDNK